MKSCYFDLHMIIRSGRFLFNNNLIICFKRLNRR